MEKIEDAIARPPLEREEVGRMLIRREEQRKKEEHEGCQKDQRNKENEVESKSEGSFRTDHGEAGDEMEEDENTAHAERKVKKAVGAEEASGLTSGQGKGLEEVFDPTEE